jgi:hypothetical protein
LGSNDHPIKQNNTINTLYLDLFRNSSWPVGLILERLKKYIVGYFVLFGIIN